MKVKVRKWRHAHPKTPALDAWFLWTIGKMPGECFERILLKHGKEHWLYHPSHHGKECPSNGEHKGVECRCDECDYYLECFPDWKEMMYQDGPACSE